MQTKPPETRRSSLDSTEVTDLTTPGYSIRPAQAEHIPALAAIELAAAQLLRGHAPEFVLAETTDERTFADAVRDGRVGLTSTRNIPVRFGIVERHSDDVAVCKRRATTPH